GAPIYYPAANTGWGRVLGPPPTAENVSARVIGQTNEAVVVNSVSFVDMPYRMAGEQPESFGQYLLQAISRGARPSTYIMGAPGRIPYANLTRVASDVTRFYRDHRDLYGALRPAATVGLVRRDLPRYGADRFADVVPELRGVYSALQEGNVPFDTLSVTDLAAIEERGELDRYDLLILPNLGGIPDRAAAALDAFADRGGRVLLTGDSAVTEEGVVQLAHAPALMGSGAPLRGESLWSTYVATQAQPDLGQYRYRDSILPIYGAYYPLVWRPDAVFSANVLPQAPFGPPEKCYGHVLGGDPGHVRSADGSVTLIPWTIGTTYHEFGITDVRDHLLAIVRELASQPVVVDAPEQVDVSVARAGESLVVHLINQSGVRRRSVGTAIAIEGVRMRLPGVPGARVRALVAGRDLTVEADGDATVVDVPRLGDFEVLVVESVGV
ncbi:hypothetical protein, partial [Pseudactinotalea sp.]|uniref:hypothetical protein n=1 Tax=Pseudactinotalea sp. TaxID=1926260 RepID=UPI003B3AB523